MNPHIRSSLAQLAISHHTTSVSHPVYERAGKFYCDHVPGDHPQRDLRGTPIEITADEAEAKNVDLAAQRAAARAEFVRTAGEVFDSVAGTSPPDGEAKPAKKAKPAKPSTEAPTEPVDPKTETV